MKKTVLALLAGCMLIGLCGCGSRGRSSMRSDPGAATETVTERNEASEEKESSPETASEGEPLLSEPLEGIAEDLAADYDSEKGSSADAISGSEGAFEKAEKETVSESDQIDTLPGDVTEKAPSDADDSDNGGKGNAAEEKPDENAGNVRIFAYEQSRYKDMFAPADDDLDFLYASDHMQLSRTVTAIDAKSYRWVLDFPKPTLSDIEKKADANRKIGDKYKSAIKSYAKNWLALWPDSDLSVLYLNLDTLKVEECTPQKIKTIGLSEGAVACYRNSENTIYVREGLTPEDRNSDDYIVWNHELTHVATTFRNKIGKSNYRIGTYGLNTPADVGSYYEEAVITNLIYQLREGNTGAKVRSVFYTVPCNYYRIFTDCIGYDGNDLMNHSAAYFAGKMGEYMNDRADAKEYAAYILELVGLDHQLANAKYLSVKVENFAPLREYTVDMYCKKYLKSGMSTQEAEKVFSDLVDEMTFNVANLSVEYEEVDPKIFRPEFEKCCEKLGISPPK